jgi:hypothetical protein
LPEVLDFAQVPIHPMVIQRLGLTWAEPDFRYKFTDRESLTLEQYVRRYIGAYG